MFKNLLRTLCVLLAAVASNANAGAFYNPFGPQTNVSLSTILDGGWTECYNQTMSVYIGNNAQNVLSQCQGKYLMMAGATTGSSNMLLLAETTFADATQNTGSNTQNTHLSNGSDWYFASNWSWGFTGANEAVSLGECDVLSGADRMCLHTINNAGGYRIGNITGLNNSVDYSKIFFVSNGDVSNVPEPASLALLGLGLAGLIASRRRKAA